MVGSGLASLLVASVMDILGFSPQASSGATHLSEASSNALPLLGEVEKKRTEYPTIQSSQAQKTWANSHHNLENRPTQARIIARWPALLHKTHTHKLVFSSPLAFALSDICLALSHPPKHNAKRSPHHSSHRSRLKHLRMSYGTPRHRPLSRQREGNRRIEQRTRSYATLTTVVSSQQQQQQDPHGERINLPSIFTADGQQNTLV